MVVNHVDHRLGRLQAVHEPALGPVGVGLGEQLLDSAEGGSLPAGRGVADQDGEQSGGVLRAAEPGVGLRAGRVPEQRQERDQDRGRICPR